MVDEPVQSEGPAYKLTMGRSAIFKMADRSTINLYAGGGLVRHYEIVYCSFDRDPAYFLN